MEHILSLIEKYWAGTATVEEKKQLLQLLDSEEPELKKRMQALFEREIPAQKKAPIIRLKTRPAKWMAAAVVFLAISLPFLSLLRARHVGQALVKNSGVPAPGNIRNSGQRERTLFLSDGSRVILYPGADLSYPLLFAADKREVRLAGKAFFSVAKDAARPFIVIGNEVTTTVLGTEFLINAQQSGCTRVQLFEGKVAVRSVARGRPPAEVVLQPGEEVLAGNDFAGLRVSRSITTEATARTTGASAGAKKRIGISSQFNFKNEPLANILKELEDWYHIPILYDAKENRHIVFTGTFSHTDSLKNILQLIVAINDLKVIQRTDSLIITK